MDPFRGVSPLARSEDEERARNLIARELTGDERILWAGRPRQGIYLVPADAATIPFSILWGGFAIFWEAMAIGSGAPWFFKLWGVPFVLVGLHMMIGRFFFDARRRKRLVYAITNRRVLIVEDGRTRKLTVVDLARGDEVRLEERPDGTGSIAFGPGVFGPLTMKVGRGPRPQIAPTFERIPDVRAVMAVLADAQAAARR